MKKSILISVLLVIVLFLWFFPCLTLIAESAQGDTISGIRLVSVKGEELTFEVDYSVEPYHGNEIYIGGWLYDSNDQAFGGYRPTVIPSSGKDKVKLVINLDRDPSFAREIEVFLFEPRQSPFIKRRFPFSMKDDINKNLITAIEKQGGSVKTGKAVVSSGRPKPEQKWEWIGAQAEALITGGEHLYMVNTVTKDIFQYNGTPGSWTRIGGPGHSFVANLGGLYALSLDRGGIYEYRGTPNKWTRIHGPARAIYAGGRKLFFTDPATGDIHKYNPRSSKHIKYDVEGPIKIGGPGHSFTVSGFGGTLYGLSPDMKGIYVYEKKPGQWKRIGGPAVRIFAGPSFLSFHTVYAIHPQNNDIYRISYTEKHGRLTGTVVPEDISVVRIGGHSAEFAVGIFQGRLWGLSPDGSGIYQFDVKTKGNNTWKKTGGPAMKIFGGAKCNQGKCIDRLYIIDSDANVWRYLGE